MDADYTHITIILDRTGSMEAIRDDTIGGFNAFLKDQQAQAGRATLTLVQFDSKDPYEVIHSFLPVAEVPPLTRETYQPRATTPLLDAIGHGILDLQDQIDDLPEQSRPGQVLFVVLTDGRENASREFKKEEVAQLISEKQENGWKFVFLGADFEAIDDARSLGVTRDALYQFAHTGEGVAEAWHDLSLSTSAMRCASDEEVDFFRHRKEPKGS
ncbi:MAG: VWA domain-containing protein [Gammaproteobacteria bacterium]|nr:MAG: VWA domain-containing protein [Gammaproteobacteria bacterium]